MLKKSPQKNLRTILSLQLLHKIGEKRNNNKALSLHQNHKWAPMMVLIMSYVCMWVDHSPGITRLEGHFSKSLVIKHVRGLSFWVGYHPRRSGVLPNVTCASRKIINRYHGKKNRQGISNNETFVVCAEENFLLLDKVPSNYAWNLFFCHWRLFKKKQLWCSHKWGWLAIRWFSQILLQNTKIRMLTT